MTFVARAFIDADSSVASVRLFVQEKGYPLITGQWELPYGLWAGWGTEQTATWLCNQFRGHDAETAAAAGPSLLRQALRRGQYRHQQDEHNQWLPFSKDE